MAGSGAALVLAEHAACGKLLPHTLGTLAAARKLLVGQVVALVAGGGPNSNLEKAAQNLSTTDGVDEVGPRRAGCRCNAQRHCVAPMRPCPAPCLGSWGACACVMHMYKKH